MMRPDGTRPSGELMRNYRPEGGEGEFLEAKTVLTAVVRIDSASMTGKEGPGKGATREQVRAALQAGSVLPMEGPLEEG